MRAKCRAEAFKQSFLAAAATTPARTPKPILQGVLLIADPVAGPCMVATDMESSLSIGVGIDVEEPGVAVLPADRVRKILATTDGAEPIGIREESRMLYMTVGTSEFEFPLEDARTFPSVESFGAESYHVISARDLRKAAARVGFSVDQNPGRRAHAGILVERTPTSMTFVALNNRTMASQEIPATVVGEPDFQGRAVVQEKALSRLAKMLDDDDAPVHVCFTENDARWRAGDVTAWGLLVSGNFLAWRRVIPPSCDVRLPLSVPAFRAAVQRAAVVTDEVTRSIDLSFGGGRLVLAGGSGSGKSRVEIPIDYSGSQFATRLSPESLLAILKAAGDDGTVTAELCGPAHIQTLEEVQENGSRQNALFRTDDGALFMISPMYIA